MDEAAEPAVPEWDPQEEREQEARQTALRAASITMSGWEGVPPAEDVLRRAARYARWILTGEGT